MLRTCKCLAALLAVTQGYSQLPNTSAPDLQVFAVSPYSDAAYELSYGEDIRLEQTTRSFLGAPTTMMLVNGKFAAGFSGVTTQPGFGSRWGEDANGLIDPFEMSRHPELVWAQLYNVNVSSGLTASIGQRFQIGAGVDLMWSDASLDLAPGQALKEESEAAGIRGNVGLTFQVTERQQVSLTYRTPCDIDYGGDPQMSRSASALGGGVFRTEMNTHVRFPMIVAAGYGINLTEKVRITADVEWLQFSQFKDLPLFVANGLPGFPGSVNENWRDTFSLGFGTEYRLGAHWIARAGYQFYQSPVPDSTLSPSVSNADQHVLTAGIAFNYRNHALEAAYGADFYNSLKMSDGREAALNGTDNFTLHLFSLAYRLVF